MDTLLELRSTGVIEPGAPHPMLLADESALVLSYWLQDGPPFHPTKAPIAIVRFQKPRWHQFGLPIAGHPLREQGLTSCAAFKVLDSSLLRRFPAASEATHYIFAFRESAFECIADGFKSAIETISWNEQHGLMMEALHRSGAAE